MTQAIQNLSPESTVTPATTPMMAQYQQLKQQHPDCLLFFRLGDFYELFFEDAIIAAQDLDITLTSRSKHGEENIPMCGVPAHAYETYLARLIQKGHKVAICEQMEDPNEAKKQGIKRPLKREVVRIVTAGTLTEDILLEGSRHNFLVAISPIFRVDQTLGVASLDISTGAFLVEETALKDLGSVLARLNPAEIVLPDRLLEEPELFETFTAYKKCLSPLPIARFDEANSRLLLEKAYRVNTLDGFGTFSAQEIKAAGALIDYVHLTQKSTLQLVSPPRKISAQSIMAIDPATRRSLEIDLSNRGTRLGSLLNAIDKTLTAAGARLLALRLSSPLTDPLEINRRLDRITFFLEQAELRRQLRELFKTCPDMERSLSRLSFGRASPRDLAGIRTGLGQAGRLKALLAAHPIAEAKSLGHHDLLVDRLTRALKDTVPLQARDGDFIADGYHPDLDNYRKLRDNGRSLIAQMQADYAARTTINSLKIRHNNILGYHIDIGPSHAAKVPTDFIHRQTLASSLRYTTVELSELAHRIEASSRQALELELQLFIDLVKEVQGQAAEILKTSRAIASLDVATSLAELAANEALTRPTVDDSLTFTIKEGRHLIVEKALKSDGGTSFVANDCTMNGDTKLLLLTGPNMAGKSTFLRQNALIAILAQMGSYVPATSAHLGVIDRLFSRVGASDDLASGRSTFMVEMVETAAILHQSTQRSFVILDEIGRGTATYDGLSIAWAVVEYICQVNTCRALFATHYHELTHLSQSLPMVECYTMRIKEWNDQVVFLHQVIKGTADKSYGIHVAALAGLPKRVLDRASQVLLTLEENRKPLTIDAQVIPFQPKITEPSAVEKTLKNLDVDNLTPRDALETLYTLKNLIK